MLASNVLQEVFGTVPHVKKQVHKLMINACKLHVQMYAIKQVLFINNSIIIHFHYIYNMYVYTILLY